MPEVAKKMKRSSEIGPPEEISVAKAKAHFSSIISSVEKKHAPVTILRRGVPVAQVVPFPHAARPLLRGSMTGKARELGDIISPIEEDWPMPEWPEPNPLAGPDPDDD